MSKRLFFLVYFFILVCSISAHASLRLFEWTADTTLAPLVLPVRDGEAPEQAAERYLKNLEGNPDLMELFSGRRPYLPNSTFKEMADRDIKKRALLVANLSKDYTLDSLRVKNFMKFFAKDGHRSLILPVSANLGLTNSESQELFQLINNKFPFLVAMGGDDVDPFQYRSENLHSRNIVPARDKFEIQLIKKYVTSDSGFLLGICRGAQISAVALGYELNQHVPFHVGTDVAHANDWHPVSIFKTKYNSLSSLADSNGQLVVNSLHHQSIRYRPGGLLEISAQAADGTTEALELKNGRGVLLQFHPELMGNTLGEKILHQIISRKMQSQTRNCEGLFR